VQDLHALDIPRDDRKTPFGLSIAQPAQARLTPVDRSLDSVPGTLDRLLGELASAYRSRRAS